MTHEMLSNSNVNMVSVNQLDKVAHSLSQYSGAKHEAKSNLQSTRSEMIRRIRKSIKSTNNTFYVLLSVV